MVRGYPKDPIEAEMKKVKFTSKNRNTNRGKSLKAVPFVMTHHPKFKLMNRAIFKHLDLLYMDNEVKRVFTPKPMISFQNARKISSYLVRAKLYPTKRSVGSYKCGGRRYDVCINVNETSTFTSTATGETYIINHRFNFNERCLVYLLTCNKCKTQYVGQTIDQFRSKWNNYKSNSGKHGQGATCM